MAHDIFISYSTKDKPVADAIVAALENRAMRCWIAPRDITPGTDYGEAIVNGLNDSRVMVLIFSASSNRSQQVIREVEPAVNKQIHIIPFRIDATEMSKAMEYYISSPHWLDALSPPMEKHIANLVETLARVLAHPQETTAINRPFAAPRATPKPNTRRNAIIMAGVAAAVVASSSIIIWNSVHRRLHPVFAAAHMNPVALTTPAPVIKTNTTSSDALLTLPVKDGLVRRFELGSEDEFGSMAQIFLAPDASTALVGPVENEEAYMSAAAWDTASGKPLYRLRRVAAVTPSPDGQRVFTSTRPEGNSIRSVRTGQKLAELDIDGGGVIAQWSRDGQHLAAAGGRRATLFHSANGLKIRDFANSVAERAVWRMCFSAEDKFLAIASLYDAKVECRDPMTGVGIWQLNAIAPRAMIQFAETGQRLRVARERTKVVNATDGHPVLDLQLSWDEVISELSPDGNWLIGAVREGTDSPLRLWSVDSGQSLNRFGSIKISFPTLLRFTPDGRRVLIGTTAGHVLVVDLATGKQVVEWSGQGSVTGISISADSRFVATSSSMANIAWLWRLPDE